MAQKNPDASKALAALSSLGDMAKLAEAMAEVQAAAAALVEDNRGLQRRINRMEFVLETLLGSVTHQSYAAEFDRLHPEPEAGEET